MALNNLAGCQAELGDFEAALVSSREAVDMYGALAGARPDAFRPDLAMALGNLSNHQAAIARRARASAATLQAVEDAIRASEHGRALPPGDTWGQTYDQDRLSEALASMAEAVAIYRPLAVDRNQIFLPKLAGSLINLSTIQADLSLRSDAMASITEAVTICRALVDVRPAVYRRLLAISLGDLSVVQSRLHRREEALVSATEALAICRALAAAQPKAFRPDVARSLHRLAWLLDSVGRHQEAEGATIEARDFE
jgi:tetratricopeptide (TPR) repeat protein